MGVDWFQSPSVLKETVSSDTSFCLADFQWLEKWVRTGKIKREWFTGKMKKVGRRKEEVVAGAGPWNRGAMGRVLGRSLNAE